VVAEFLQRLTEVPLWYTSKQFHPGVRRDSGQSLGHRTGPRGVAKAVCGDKERYRGHFWWVVTR